MPNYYNKNIWDLILLIEFLFQSRCPEIADILKRRFFIFSDISNLINMKPIFRLISTRSCARPTSMRSPTQFRAGEILTAGSSMSLTSRTALIRFEQNSWRWIRFSDVRGQKYDKVYNLVRLDGPAFLTLNVKSLVKVKVIFLRDLPIESTYLLLTCISTTGRWLNSPA